MRLVLFTPPTTLPNEHAALHSLASRSKSSSAFVPLPAALHVRKPGADEASVEDYLERLPEALLERTVLHSHHALASKFDIQGIHFTEAARSALGGRPQRPAATKGSRSLTLSTSLHSCAEVEAEAAAAAAAAAAGAAAAQGGSPDPACCASSCSSFDYVFLSPLFESISKPGYGGGQGDGTGASAKFWRSGDDEQSSSSPSPALAAALLSARESPRRLGVVALGGVDASRLRLVQGLGFEAAAVLGAVWGSEKDPVEAWAEVVEAAAAVNAAAADACR